MNRAGREVGQEASTRFVKNLSAAFAERGAARKKRITLTSKMQRLLPVCAAGGSWRRKMHIVLGSL